MAYEFLGRGIYRFTEVATLSGTSPSRVRAWFKGWPRGAGPLIAGDYGRGGRPARLLSFLDLIDTLVVSRLREHSVPLPYLRKVHTRLVEEFRVDHPFSRRDLLTDGRRVFLDVADAVGEEKLKELLTQQLAFPDVLKPYLKLVDYDRESLLAMRWHVARGVLIDPRREYGKPVLASAGIPTAILSAAYSANARDAHRVGYWYGITTEDVQVAVDFEATLGRSAA